MMRRVMMLVGLLTVAMSTQEAVANCVQNNNKLGLVGLDTSTGGIFAGVSDHDNGCACTAFRFMTANTDTKMALSVLLAARMSGKKVRIDALDGTNCNSAYRVYIQNPD